jgi:hypothetical protein
LISAELLDCQVSDTLLCRLAFPPLQRPTAPEAGIDIVAAASAVSMVDVRRKRCPANPRTIRDGRV